MINTILFPSSFFSVKKVGEDLQEEYDAVINTGLFQVVIFGYEKWFSDGCSDGQNYTTFFQKLYQCFE